MEKSIFEKEPKKTEDEKGEKNRIINSDAAQEYYKTAAKVSGVEYGIELSNRDYEQLDAVLKIIRDNKISQRLDIVWDDLNREQLLFIYKNSELISREKPLLFEKIKKYSYLISLPMTAALFLISLAQYRPMLVKSIDEALQTNGAFIDLCNNNLWHSDKIKATKILYGDFREADLTNKSVLSKLNEACTAPKLTKDEENELQTLEKQQDLTIENSSRKNKLIEKELNASYADSLKSLLELTKKLNQEGLSNLTAINKNFSEEWKNLNKVFDDKWINITMESNNQWQKICEEENSEYSKAMSEDEKSQIVDKYEKIKSDSITNEQRAKTILMNDRDNNRMMATENKQNAIKELTDNPEYSI